MLHPRHRIDLGWRDLGTAWIALGAVRSSAHRARIVAHWGPEAEVWVSVRSALEAWLTARAFDAGATVLLTAPTHPDLARIVRAHGLQPLGVDLDRGTLRPTVATLDEAASDAVVALIVSNAYGARGSLDAVQTWCAARGIDLVEDAATAFRGPGDRGDSRAALTVFSFGDTKHCTALGGAVTVVRDRALLDRMRRVRATWPRRGRRAWSAKVVLHTMLAILREPRLFAILDRVAGQRLDRWVREATRSMPDVASHLLRATLQRRPHPGLLALLAARLQRYDSARADRRECRAREIVDALGDPVPGWRQPEHTWWTLPVQVDDVDGLRVALRAEGFDTARGDAAMASIPGAPAALAMIRSTVFVPAYPEIPPHDHARLVATVRRWTDPRRLQSGESGVG